MRGAKLKMASHPAHTRAISSDRWFFGTATLAMTAVIVIGFLPSYYMRGVIPAPHPLLPMTTLVHIHGAVFTAWMLLFLVQTLLISAGRADMHRQLGLASLVLLPVMIVVAIFARWIVSPLG